MISILLVIILLLPETEPLQLLEKVKLDVPEPSDMVFDHENNKLFVVSDNGIIFSLNLKGEIIGESTFAGSDFEAVELKGDTVLAMDETFRTLQFFDKELNHIGSKDFQYLGGRNKGVESLAWNHISNSGLMVTEKSPSWAISLDNNLQVTTKKELSFCTDISSARYRNKSLYVLCDEDRLLIQIDPTTWEEKSRYRVPVHNPEGFDFVNDQLWVVSDDRQMLYKLKMPD